MLSWFLLRGDPTTCGAGCTYIAPVAAVTEVTESCFASVDCTFPTGDSSWDVTGGCVYTASAAVAERSGGPAGRMLRGGAGAADDDQAPPLGNASLPLPPPRRALQVADERAGLLAFKASGTDPSSISCACLTPPAVTSWATFQAIKLTSWLPICPRLAWQSSMAQRRSWRR